MSRRAPSLISPWQLGGGLVLAGLAYLLLATAAWAGLPAFGAFSGSVSATLKFQIGGVPPGSPHQGEYHLQILRSGVSYYEAPARSSLCASQCSPEDSSGPPLAVADLEGNAQPDVILKLNTGGAHCCTVVQVFAFDPGAGTYGLVERDFGDPGAKLTDVAGDGSLEFESADDRFAYLFTSYAYSGMPLQIWRFHEGRFVDATRSFPQALTKDAARQFKYFLANRKQGHGLGILAAWAGDEELLGRGALVTLTLGREQRAHRLRSAEAPRQGGGVYVRKLERFLAKSGYIA